MNDEKIARLVVDYLLAEAGGMVQPDKGDDKDDSEEKEEKKGKGKSGKPGQIEKIFGIFEAKLFAVLTPVALVATLFASMTSGMSVFLGAIKILGATLGLILAPGVIAFSALILTLSDFIQDALLPNLEQWYSAVLNFAVGGIDWLEKQFVYLANEAIKFANNLLSATPAILRFTAEVFKAAAMLAILTDDNKSADKNMNTAFDLEQMARKAEKSPRVAGLVKSSILDSLGLQHDAEGNIQPIQGGSFGSRFRGNLRKSVDQMAFENMPKSQQTSLSGANMAAQMATIQMSPFEREQLKLSALQLDVAYKVLAKTTPPTTS